MPDKRQEELWCHSCTQYVQFMIDYDLDGRHILNCPNCDHEHYRVVRNGEITAERWGQDPRQGGQTFIVTNVTSSTVSMDTTGWSGTITNWTTTGTTAGTGTNNFINIA